MPTNFVNILYKVRKRGERDSFCKKKKRERERDFGDWKEEERRPPSPPPIKKRVSEISSKFTMAIFMRRGGEGVEDGHSSTGS